MQTAEGRLYLFVAIDRTSKFAFVELHSKATRRVAADFLRNLADAVPYKINTILTDNGTHFTDPAGDSWSVSDIKAMRAEGVLQPRLRNLPRDHRGSMRRLAEAHRQTRDHYLNRNAPMGSCRSDPMTVGISRGGAPMKNLAHSASFHS